MGSIDYMWIQTGGGFRLFVLVINNVNEQRKVSAAGTELNGSTIHLHMRGRE